MDKKKTRKERKKKKISDNNCDLASSMTGLSPSSIISTFGATRGRSGMGGGGGIRKFAICVKSFDHCTRRKRSC